MPRSAESQPELALQGSLFGDPEPPVSAAGEADEPIDAGGDLSDAALGADAASRPRKRQATQMSSVTNEETDAQADNADENDDDQPAWAHHSQVDQSQLTPMLRHYVEVKAAHPERVLLYRLGDFFECFFEDAITLSRLLELTLTGKEGGKAIGRVPMAGIPHHAAERYCSELIRRGFSVALCDQLEATPAKGALLKRDITRVLTPGTVLEEGVDLAARCRPAFQVGGDYYDFIPTRPELIGRRRECGRWALVMGDVMGKGVPAGLLMTMLRGMLRAEVLSGLPPDRILHDLNQLAQEDLAQSHRFVTLFYSDFDPRSRRLRYANAAHNPPLLWRAQHRSIGRLDAAGLLIGLQPEAEYGLGEVLLEPGDVLLYYTDGVTEAPGMTGDRFDEARLIRTLDLACRSGQGSQGILNTLFDRLDRFVGKDHQLEDDASMVVLKVPEAVTLPSVSASSSSLTS